MRADDPTPVPDPAGPTSPEAAYCTHGETLCRIVIWTEQEWERLDPAERPEPSAFVPGLGWIAPIPCSGPV
jgi:hypothetical protein